MKRRRVKITGIGPVTPAGIGREAFWKGILEPVSRVRPYTKIGGEYGPIVAGYIDRFEIGRYVDRSRLPKGASRQSLFAIAGSILALGDAGLSTSALSDARVAVITGSSLMDFGGLMATFEAVRKGGADFAHGRTVHSVGVGSVPSAVNHVLRLNARTIGISNQCCSGLDAIGYASSLVASGEIDIAICGGTDAPLHRTPLLELRAAGVISVTDEMPERQTRPFDLWRNKGAIAEGCGMIVLEPEDSPREGYSYITGYGFAYDIDEVACSGLLQAMQIAIAHARLHPGDIDVINAWGPGDKWVDSGESKVLSAVFRNRLKEIAVTSIKGAIGSPLGAAPAIQVVASALGHRNGMLPPTVNWEYPDPECRLNLSCLPTPISHEATLVNAHGVGAVNSSLILERC